MTSFPQIICLDDDKDIRTTIMESLTSKGYKVYAASTAKEFYSTIETKKIDLALIDLLMPDIDGISLLKNFRKTHTTPVIMISGRSEYIDKIMGIEAGADDYLAKPFSYDELEVRIRAILRRVNTKIANEDNHQRLYFGDYIYDPSTYQVLTINEETIGLTTSEFFLLQLLISNHGKAVTREKIIQELKQNSYDIYDRAVDVQISKIRSKLRERSSTAQYIKTIRNVGYIFCADIYEEQRKQA